MLYAKCKPDPESYRRAAVCLGSPHRPSWLIPKAHGTGIGRNVRRRDAAPVGNNGEGSSSVHNEAVRRQSAHSISIDIEGLPELGVSSSTSLNVSTLKLDQPRECNRCKLAGVEIARKRANNVFFEDREGEAVE
nr:hypothetical protein [Tanacetum cinerariifolium]